MNNRTRNFVLVAVLIVAASYRAFAQQPATLPPGYIRVSAPMAQKLTLETKSRHPEITKIGIHATPRSASDNAIIAIETVSKIGKKSSDKDMEKVAHAVPTVERIEAEGIYDLFLPLSDARGRDIGQGFVVMEVPFKNASGPKAALKIGELIRDEMQRKISSRDALYQ